MRICSKNLGSDIVETSGIKNFVPMQLALCFIECIQLSFVLFAATEYCPGEVHVNEYELQYIIYMLKLLEYDKLYWA